MANVEKQDLAAVAKVSGSASDMCLLAEVGGSIVRVNASDVLPYREEDVMYGVEWDETAASPDCTRIGNIALHKTLPIQSLMRGCLLDDNGNVVKYLSEDDWTGEDRSGKSGQVMVEIPKHYRKCEKDGNKRRVKLSLYPLPGYLTVKKMYISAYEAVVDRTNNKLCSIVNTAAQYRGGTNDSTLDGKDNTLLGRPATSLSLTLFRAYARKRKSSTTEWNCMTQDAQNTLVWLFVVEYATRNSQKAYNAALTSEGYRQGGLGDGVTTIDYSKWTAWNKNNPFVACGYTDALGNNTGIKEYTLPSTYDSTAKKVSVPRYRGIENPFGHVNKHTDGVLIEVNPDSGNKLSKIYVCHDPAKFADTISSAYTYIGNAPRSSGYIKTIAFTAEGDICATSIGGGSTSYYPDQFYMSDIPTAVSIRCALSGGAAHHGAIAGLFFENAAFAPSYAPANVGSRLCFIPAAA